MNTIKTMSMLLAAGLFTSVAAAHATLSDTPAETPGSPTPAEAAKAPPAPVKADAELEALTRLTAGTYTDGKRVITLSPVSIAGAPGALFCEIFLTGRESQPEAHVIMQFVKRRGTTYLRMYRFPGGGTIAPGLAGVPEAFPEVEGSRLDLLTDVPVESDSTSNPTTFVARTKDPIATNTGGALEMTTQMKVDRDGLMIYEVGFDAEGKEIWAFPVGDRVVFKRDHSPSTLEKRPSGLCIIDVKPAADEAAKTGRPGDTFVVHYTGWLPNGQVFDTSKQEGRTPFEVTIPGGVIQGWNEGLQGMKVGSTRRLIIPPTLAYGPRGAGGVIPPNAWLVFDIELLDVKRPESAPPAPAATAPSNAGRPVDPVKDADKVVDDKKQHDKKPQ